MLTPAQSRAARGLLDLTAEALAATSGVPVTTIQAFEAGTAPGSPQEIAALRHALDAAGVTFIDAGGLGVQLKETSESLMPEQLNASNDG